jgi:NADH:ubiquinone oxidoreductase subunit 6 (subunit J)
MSVVHVVFIILSLVTLGAALAVVTNRNLFHSALFLVMAFVGVAGLYLLLEAPFLAVVQVLIYVGAIAVLILFAVMLSRRLMAEGQVQRNAQWWIAAIVALLLFAALGLIVTRQIGWSVSDTAPVADAVSLLGQKFMSTYVLPFEVASVLLLVALVGSIIIAREKE